jgi:hypothetical protein
MSRGALQLFSARPEPLPRRQLPWTRTFKKLGDPLDGLDANVAAVQQTRYLIISFGLG